MELETWKVIASLGVGALGMAITLILTFRYLKDARLSLVTANKEHEDRLAALIGNYDNVCTGYNQLCKETNNHMMTLFRENLSIIKTIQASQDKNTAVLSELVTLIKVMNERLHP